ncbi:MAG TPA: serine protease [Steroidobacteraceae bacterium]|nr:serine protease [Steroidobacteraceae bacterium]
MSIQVRRQILPGLALALAASVLFLAPARSADLDTATHQQILAATFEVVQLKPPEQTVTYERALPLELIPYQQRVDKYRSIGTAFAIGPNRYVTAGHVLVLGMGSQFGPPALRDAAGEVYDIDRVLKYSDDQDFVVFSLKREPATRKTLAIGSNPPLNDPVFAVGNALGQGVVIRDGVYTSDTPEEANGRWKWLRFTAAASPGNSGGPLVDKNGRVIGIVLRKSESENLNYAAPIALVAAAPENAATIDNRANFRLAVMDAAEVIETHERLPLPASLADFYAGLRKIMVALVAHSEAQVLEHNKDHIFPNGAGADVLLHQVYRSPMPRVIHQQQDRNWVLGSPQVQEARLDHNGFVRYGGFLYRLRLPDDVRLASLYSDSAVFMDLMLRSGYSLSRQVGTDSVKVTSLGKAIEESRHTDNYGRLWQVKIWAIPFDDAFLVTLNLPTPEGYASLFMTARGYLRDIVLDQEKLLSSFIYATPEGTLARWREYLPLKAYQPKAMADLKIDIAADYRHLHIASRRLELDVTSDMLSLAADSILSLNYGFYPDGATVVWDVGGIAVGEGTKVNYLDVRRALAPDATLPDGFQNSWKKVIAGDFPFNGVAASDNGGMKASIAVPPGGTTPVTPDEVKVRYLLTVRNEGAPSQDAMRAKLDAFLKAFKPLEH